MRECILAGFFSGELPATELAKDVHGATKRGSDVVRHTSIENMAQPFLVTRDMLVRLCESVLDGVVPPEALEDIGFALITSDAFHWDETDDQLAETLYDWSSPEINYPLTLENVQMFRNRLGQHPGS